MSINYLITFDYELFGSGKGSITKHLIEPTNKILSTLKKREVKATFFVEQLEIDAFISLREYHPPSSIEYKESVLIEEQLHAIIKQGHDIQLHLHPQWYNATYSNGSWDLNFDWWRFSSLPFRHSDDGTPGKYDLIKNGKASLERLLRKTDPAYECIAFRAGGYNVGQDIDSIQALIKNGIVLDSSVCPGYYQNSSLSNFDYTQVTQKEFFWLSSESLLKENAVHAPLSCIELPLISVKSTLIEKLSIARVVNSISNRSYKKINHLASQEMTDNDKREAVTNSNYDVCLSSHQQLRKFETKIRKMRPTNNPLTPIVLIGHPKDYNVFSPLEKIISRLDNTQCITIAEFIDDMSSVTSMSVPSLEPHTVSNS
jgi:hypothetical protein